MIPRFSGSAKCYACQGLGTFRQGKRLLENWPRLRERCWTFSSETATAFLSSSEGRLQLAFPDFSSPLESISVCDPRPPVPIKDAQHTTFPQHKGVQTNNHPTWQKGVLGPKRPQQSPKRDTKSPHPSWILVFAWSFLSFFRPMFFGKTCQEKCPRKNSPKHLKVAF